LTFTGNLQNAALKSEITFKTSQKHHEKRHVLESPNPLSFGRYSFFEHFFSKHFSKSEVRVRIKKIPRPQMD
jgi:hypothetical protein